MLLTLAGRDDDTDLAVALGKPLVLEETGFSSGANRAARILASARGWKKTGAAGYMQWGFLATKADNGDGDKQYGMDALFHDDFAALSAAFTTLASEYR